MQSAMTEKMATWTEFPNTRGQPTERLINLYSAWGVGGFGLVVTGNLMVHPTMLEAAGNAVITRENTSPQLVELYRRWAEAIKEQGSLAIAQLAIAGRQTPFALDRNPYSASDVQLVAPMSKFGQPIPLTVEQIRTEVVDRFVYAAKLLKETGWDGVQLGAAHGFLLSQFISPTTNKRTDKYGGCIENRMRIVIEVHDAIREKIPTTSGFIVGVKTNSVEFQNDGLDTADAVRSAELLDKAGFDFIELSGGSMEDWGYKHREKESTRRREAYFLEFADKIRPVVSSAVLFVTGGFRTTKGMVDAITSGVTNGIGIARPAASEPDLPKKILNGGVHAASDNKFPADNHIVQLMIAMTQMWYIGNRPMHDKSDPCEDIPDFSVPEEAANFQQVALPAFFANFMSKLHADEPFVDIPEYVPLASA